MMKTQFAFVLLAFVVCLVKGDVPQAQYACSRHNSEAKILRLQPYLTAMEVEHSIKLVIAEQIYTKMAALGVAAADITSLRSKTTTKGSTVANNMFGLMGKCQTLADHLGSTNSDVVYEPTKLSADLTQLNSLLADLNGVFQPYVENMALFVDVFVSDVEVLIATKSGSEVAEIYTLLNQVTAIKTVRVDQMTKAKVQADLAAPVTQSALQALITP